MKKKELEVLTVVADNLVSLLYEKATRQLDVSLEEIKLMKLIIQNGIITVEKE